MNKLSDCAGLALSPDGHQALFEDDGEIWLLDLVTCESRNLTNTPEVWEGNPQWWPARPDLVIFGVNPEMDYGHPAAVQVDGEGYTILDESGTSRNMAALSPDGETIAYDIYGGTAWLYQWGDGKQPFIPDQFDLSGVILSTISSPAWAPDGDQIAWVVGVREEEGQTAQQIAIAVFNLDTQTARLVHPYMPVGRGGWPPPPVWSPDGTWLAFNPWDENQSESGIWVAAADGSEEYYLDIGLTQPQSLWQSGRPYWSPDGRWLAFSLAPSGYSETWYLEVGAWKPIHINTTPNTTLMDWRVLDE